ncbi:spermidine/putrescine ABC transporter substrate-binding protein, partial [Pseudomonas ogarae]
MEVDLLAAGVKSQDLYKVLDTPEGVSRALAKLAPSKPNAAWWVDDGQAEQRLVGGEAAKSADYNARIASAKKDGMKLSIVWPQSLYDPEYW